MGELPGTLSEYVDMLFSWGAFWVYAAIFAACFIENIVPPFPGDTFILAGGALVGLGRLDPWLTGAIVVVGGVLSVMILYRFGRRHGRTFFMEKDYRFFSADDIREVEKLLARWGGLVMISSRFIVGVRSAIAVTAGMARYPTVSMLIFSVLSYILFTVLLMFTAYGLVSNLDRLEEWVGTYQGIVWILVGIVMTGLLIVQIIRKRRLP